LPLFHAIAIIDTPLFIDIAADTLTLDGSFSRR
jgi:hypothetical protein